MKKYRLFINVLLVLLCLFPLIFSCLTCFKTAQIDMTYVHQIVTDAEISPTFTASFKEVFNEAFGISESKGFDIFCVILSNSVFVYIGYVFVEVLVFIPKMAISLLRLFARKED